MQKIQLTLGILGMLILAQLAPPTWTIMQKELTLRIGRQYRFQAAPIDPYEAFLCGHLALHLKEDHARIAAEDRLTRNQKVYVELQEDSSGFAKIAKITTMKPNDTESFLNSQVVNLSDSVAYLKFPFENYYINEEVAPITEAVYREHAHGAEEDVFVAVRVKNGVGVLEDLYVAGMPLLQYVQKHLE